MEKMKKTICLLSLVIFTAVTSLYAQVTEVCAGDGIDSVTLFVSNYQYGNIQWQYSDDFHTWTDIPGANDTVYSFVPERIRFYRAWMQYPNCPADSSPVTLVQFSPTADAGPDRVLNAGNVIQLHGNTVDNARYMWQVIEGDAPVLEDPSYPQSQFSGTDTLYRLTWTVVNACGVSVDTVEIRYMESRYYDAIVIVDSTDIILSDSTEHAAGIYRIIFSAPIPNITDSTVLMGITNGGFLRKVIEFEYYGDTCEMITIQAYLTDILVQGAMNLEIPVILGNGTPQRGRGGNPFTRAALLDDPRYLSGQWDALISEMMNEGNTSSRTGNRNVFSGYISDGPIQLSAGVSAQDLHIYFADDNPIKYDFWIDPNDGQYHSYVMCVDVLHIDFTLVAMTGSVAVTKNISTPAGISKDGVGGMGLVVPIEVSGTFSGNLEMPVRITKPLRIGAFYKGDLNPWTIFEDLEWINKSEKTIVEKELVSAPSEFELSLSVGAKLFFKLYKLPGFALNILPTLSYSMCEGTNGFKSQTIESYLKISTEYYVSLFGGNDEEGLNHEWPPFDQETWHTPYKLVPLTDRNLVPSAVGAYISEPIQVQVFNQDNRPVKSGLKVLFQCDGELSSTPSGSGPSTLSAFTDNNGIAQIYWKPNNATTPTLQVVVEDCEGHSIKGSPYCFFADHACASSTLSLDVVDGHLSPSGAVGSSGSLQYSADNSSWSSSAPCPLTPGQTYFVQDINGCKAATTYVVEELTPVCNLGLNTQQNGLAVLMVVNNGIAPYHYYVDGVDQTPSGYSNWRWQHTFTHEGSHSLAVSDANGCVMNMVVSVSDGTVVPTVATSTTYNRVHDVYDQVMGAVTDNGGAAITERGVQWSLNADMSNATNVTSSFTGDGFGRYVCSISGVSAGTTYYARAYASNNRGTAYGEVISVTVPGGGGDAPSGNVDGQPCPNAATVADIDGNVYNTVQIGEQCWMRENLRTTRYSDGTVIEAGTSTSTTIPYRYVLANVATYGYLYNWPALMHGRASSNANPSGVQGICPDGWHVPSDAEWTQLTNYVSGQDNYVCGDNSNNIAKALAATTGWNTFTFMGGCNPGDQSVHANNATGFSVLPAGQYSGYGYYHGEGDSPGVCAYFWSATQDYSLSAYERYLCYDGNAYVYRSSNNKGFGMSVRCLRD